MAKVSWKDRLRYAFDNFMSRGIGALVAGLGILLLVMIVVAATLLSLTGIHPADGATLGFVEAVWASLMRTLDPGTMGGDTGWGFRLVMFGVTLGGVFILSTLIGVLSSGIRTKMEELREGHSRVIESGHTLILGWAPHVLSIISELIVANANQPRSCIVILGDEHKPEMEDEIRRAVGYFGRTRIVCRSGSPVSMADLEIVSPQTSRSIIVVSPQEDHPDADVIKTILAITNNPRRRPEPYHIVAELRDPKNHPVLSMIGQDELEIVLVGNVISRIIAQTCRQSGLSVVYNELLAFEGDEMYFQAEPALTGKTFGETLLCYEDSAVLGLFREDGSVKLNPSMDTRLQAGDQVIAISEDDDTIRLSGRADLDIDEDAIQSSAQEAYLPERTLVLGWNWHVPSVIRELDGYVAPGSQVTVMADRGDGEAIMAQLDSSLINQVCRFLPGDITNRRTLDEMSLETYDHVIVMAYSDDLTVKEADAVTLVALLHLRDIADRHERCFSIVSELLDVRTRELAEVTRADDFIVSDRLTSLLLSQVSENKWLNAVFTDLFDPQGSEVYLKPVESYVTTGRPVNFYTVVAAARRRGEVAVGYRLKGDAADASRAYGVVVNPDKSRQVTFDPDDRIIVLAED